MPMLGQVNRAVIIPLVEVGKVVFHVLRREEDVR